jgi:hypothetical protein
MTTPANLTYTDIETRVLNQLRIPTSNATEQAKVAAVINEVYRDLYVKEDWWWLIKRTVVNTVAKITAGTVNVSNGSTALTFTNAPGLVTGYVLMVQGDSNDSGAVYRIASTGTGASQTLDAAATATSNTVAGYRLYQDSYSLPTDCGKVLLVKRYGERLPLKMVGMQEFSRYKILDTTEGKPEIVTVFDFNTTGDPTTARQLQVHPYPDRTYRLEVFYKQQLNTELSGTTQSFMPDEYRQILVYGALARCYPIFLNDLERGKYFQSLFNDTLALMVGTHREYMKDRPSIVPDNSYRMNRRPQRTATTLGNWFDRLPINP